eukprot:Nk52_evm31s2152 gene=Nk52_evmTU31s2152
MSQVESAKKKAAYAAVDNHVKPGMVVGIGSGSTVVYAVERLISLVENGTLPVMTCVPTSFQSTQLIIQAGSDKLRLSDLNQEPVIDVTIDGADECDAELNLIKGGGGCASQEKVVAQSSKVMVVIADYRKDTNTLGTVWQKGIPCDVLPMAYSSVQRRLKSQLGLDSKLRMAVNKAGPVVNDNGNFILDICFDQRAEGSKKMWRSSGELKVLEGEIETMAGVVTCGLFVGIAEYVYFGQEDGEVLGELNWEGEEFLGGVTERETVKVDSVEYHLQL